jgi:hypothetical protein
MIRNISMHDGFWGLPFLSERFNPMRRFFLEESPECLTMERQMGITSNGVLL